MAKFSLATSAHTKGGKLSFQNFFYGGEIFFLPKGGHGPMPPPHKYATGREARNQILRILSEMSQFSVDFLCLRIQNKRAMRTTV